MVYYIKSYEDNSEARSSIKAKELCCKPEGREF
jgi:hypothetical protein